MKASQSYWCRAARIGRSVFESKLFDNLDEQAGPAYFGGLWLSRQLFWHRLRMSLQQAPERPGNICLDYGCGFGLALPLLGKWFRRVIGIDTMPVLSREFMKRWDGETNAGLRNVRIAANLQEAALQENSVDLILALDVLEHIELLPDTLSRLRAALTPGGLLIVSGPTENWAYRWGRRLVGFSGVYHRYSVYDVMTAMKPGFLVEPPRRLPYCPPLFLITRATKAA